MDIENERVLRMLSGRQTFLTDGGLETVMIFDQGFELPLFAAFTLLDSVAGTTALKTYYRRFAQMAQAHGTGLVLDTPTWRASTGWGAQLGLSPADMAKVNRRAVAFVRSIRQAHEQPQAPMVLNGVVGPQGDGYAPEAQLTVAEAEDYHRHQIGALAKAGVDMISAMTMTHSDEALGIARAAKAADVPAVISFTVETDGRLPSGEGLETAIARVDRETGTGPLFYMINCAHPSHFDGVLKGDWLQRVRGVRANASRMSHAELDAAEELDAGNPAELGQDYAALRRALPALTVMGGCCGTDHRHIQAIAAANCAPVAA